MITPNFQRLGAISCIIAILLFGASATSYAQNSMEPTLVLRPHCDGVPEECPSYEIRDPESIQTPILSVGDQMDMDLVLKNPGAESITRFRAWLAYDPTLLQGTSIEISEAFPSPTPGEAGFSPTEGYIKLSGTADEPVTDAEIIVARIQFTIIGVRGNGTPIAFYDNDQTDDIETGAFSGDGSDEENILPGELGYLYIRTTTDEAASSSSSAASSEDAFVSSEQTSETISSAASSVSTVFTLLQVQGLRITTEGSSVFLAWDVLPSTELAGYNVYYGTTSGRYIQRRGVDASASSLTLRALPVGTTYYFAIRGINIGEQETDFSREVAVSVGMPETSTSPLVASTLPASTPPSGGTVAGTTGSASMLMVLLVLSAIIGTFLSFRRQFALQRV